MHARTFFSLLCCSRSSLLWAAHLHQRSPTSRPLTSLVSTGFPSAPPGARGWSSPGTQLEWRVDCRRSFCSLGLNENFQRKLWRIESKRWYKRCHLKAGMNRGKCSVVKASLALAATALSLLHSSAYSGLSASCFAEREKRLWPLAACQSTTASPSGVQPPTPTPGFFYSHAPQLFCR